MTGPMSGGTGAVCGPGAPGSLEHGSGAGPACHWPLRSYLELAPLAGAVPCARLHARLVLGGGWGLPPDTAELIVSGLGTNPGQASAGLAGSRDARRWTPGAPPLRPWPAPDPPSLLPPARAPHTRPPPR